MPKRSMWRVAQFDRLRLRLIKAAARVVEMKTMIRVQLPTSCTAQDILHLVSRAPTSGPTPEKTRRVYEQPTDEITRAPPFARRTGQEIDDYCGTSHGQRCDVRTT